MGPNQKSSGGMLLPRKAEAWLTPLTWTGFARRSRARSGVARIIAAPPSLIRQSSSRRSGSTMRFEARWSATVIGVRITAPGLREAWSRKVTATCANCSLALPYRCMWRRTMMACAAPGDIMP